jgi:hypothetical protein
MGANSDIVKQVGNVPSSTIGSNLEKIPGSGLDNILRCVRKSLFALYFAGYSDSSATTVVSV